MLTQDLIANQNIAKPGQDSDALTITLEESREAGWVAVETLGSGVQGPHFELQGTR